MPYPLLASCYIPESSESGTFIGISGSRAVTWHRISEHVATLITTFSEKHYVVIRFQNIDGAFIWPNPVTAQPSDFWQISNESITKLAGWYSTSVRSSQAANSAK